NIATPGVTDPTTIVLFNSGQATGAAMSRTVFNDQGGSLIPPGGAPYRGTFRPAQALSAFNDNGGIPFDQSDINGNWKLRVIDTSVNGSGGTLSGWGLVVNPNA